MTHVRKHHTRFAFSIVAVLISAGCEADGSTERRTQALLVSDTYVRTEMKLDPRTFTSRTLDDGSTWIVIYHAPPGMTGGGPLVGIDKETLTVVRACAGGQ